MLSRLWRFCCSLKLAILLASTITLLGMAGSLLMHFNPAVFSGLDDQILLRWWQVSGASNFNLSWWMMLTALLLVLFGLNTLCCFFDWATALRYRWRKLGEYMIHAGFVLILCAFIWGSLGGSRSGNLQLVPGEITPLEALPGYYLRLDSFSPRLSESGRPLDLLNQVSLLQGDQTVLQEQVRFNHPLLYRNLVVVPLSFGRAAVGFSALIPGLGDVELRPGTALQRSDGSSLEVLQFLANAVLHQGKVRSRGDRLGNPAFELRLLRADGSLWQGWYFLRQQLPLELVTSGLRIWPKQPLIESYSVLQANTDPGAPVALAGGIALLFGALTALLSFYRKRSRGDRPVID